ncbi:MAG: substrate-binding domain-containing protein [Halobacteriaceae archaeon]
MHGSASRRRLLQTAGVAGTALLAGCGGGDGDGQSTTAGTTTLPGLAASRVDVLLPETTSFYYGWMAGSLQEILGHVDGVADASTVRDAGGDAATQRSHLQAAEAAGADAVVLAPVADAALADAVAAASVPVVVADRPVAPDARASLVAHDDERMARDAIEVLGSLLIEADARSSYTLAHLAVGGDAGEDPAYGERAAGFENALRVRSTMSTAETVAVAADPAAAASAVGDLLAEYGEGIHGFYAEDDRLAMGAHRAAADADVDPYAVVGIGGRRAWVEQFGEGRHYGTVGRWPPGVLSRALEVASLAANDEQVPETAGTAGVPVTRESAAGYLDQDYEFE